MPTYYTGNSANITTPLQATINGATNASPIVISTVAAHNFTTNDNVTVFDVLGNTAANGDWQITVVDATHFQLNDSTGSGTYTSGGFALDNSLTPAFQLPSDGDAFTVTGINPALQALADRTQVLAMRGIARTEVFVNTGFVEWVAPPGVFLVLAFGFGGGGGGERPFQNPGSDAMANSFTPGGSGGGAAPLTVSYIGVNPGTTYGIVCGGGGTGGTSDGEGGQNGGSTVFSLSGTPFFQAPGGVGGGASNLTGAIDPSNDFSTPVGACGRGGVGIDGPTIDLFPVLATIFSPAFGTNASDAQSHLPGAGGSNYIVFNNDGGGPANGGFHGQDGVYGHSITPGASPGTTGSPYSESAGPYFVISGNRGGGGGCGPGGISGGTGGNGGVCSIGSTGGNGTAGTAAFAGSGGGGGGGGQGGQAVEGHSSGSNGNGGNGGSGGLILVYYTSEIGFGVSG